MVIKIDLFFLNKIWCKWSCPALKGFWLFFNRIKLTDKNSYTKITTDHASNIGWTNFWFAKYIKINEIIKPNNKLPLSPKKSFGSLRIEKLKHKKTPSGNNIVIKNKLKLWFWTKKNKINITQIVVKLNVPSNPSK